MKRMALLIVVFALASACASPEATRQRGGGRGADVNNRPATVKLHEGSRQYWKTPVRISGESKGPPLDASEQAHHLALPGDRNR
jgi:hypothetical protein